MTISEAITAVLTASHVGDQNFRWFLRFNDPEVVAMRQALEQLADAVREEDSPVPEHLVLNAQKAMRLRYDLEGRLPVVYSGKSIEEWYSLFCQETLRLHKATILLKRAYDGMHKDHWAEGETESEVCDDIRHFLDGLSTNSESVDTSR